MSAVASNQPFVFNAGDIPASSRAAPSGSNDPIVDQTRREISAIVRDVAMAARSERTTDDFFRLLVDRIHRAMAAEGVVVWRCHDADDTDNSSDWMFHPCYRVGTTTDQSIPPEDTAIHHGLVVEIASEGQPAVVPPTPGVGDSGMPANPGPTPVAVVPIESDSGIGGKQRVVSEYVIEVFLDGDCGIATQRGYLRFIAQMADLAGEFLRADQLRRLRRSAALSQRIDETITRIGSLTSRQRIEAAIVDSAAELFDFDRVGLCIVNGRSARLSAVSHVESIDSRSASARQICDAAAQLQSRHGEFLFVEDTPCAAGSTNADDGSGPDAETLIVQVIASPLPDSNLRLVCLAHADIGPISSEQQSAVRRFAQQSAHAWQMAGRLESIPGGRWISALRSDLGTRRTRVARRIVMSGCAIAAIFLAAWVPVPLVVTAPATLRPQSVQQCFAPRSAIVDQLHVKHGDQVAAGMVLVTLVDPDLDQRIVSLLGRRGVLQQQQSHWTEELVTASIQNVDRNEQLQGERNLVAEEIHSIDEQIALLKQVQDSLVIRADREGIVDAWQGNQRLAGRPLQRGDFLFQLVEKDSRWVVDAKVTPKRISDLDRAIADKCLTTTVALDANPTQPWPAQLSEIGPTVVDENASNAATAVSLAIATEASDVVETIGHGQFAQSIAGAPARVSFHCGSVPLGYLLLRDVWQQIRCTIGLYVG